MRRALALAIVIVFVILGSFGTSSLAAQQPHQELFQPAGRVDVLASSITAVQAGVELSMLAGRYVRIGLIGAAGDAWRGEASGLSARVDVVGRFMLDPDFMTHWAPYAGVGVGGRYDRIERTRWHGVLIALIGVEGPKWGDVVPFIEAGYGGGARVGIGFRRARARGR